MKCNLCPRQCDSIRTGNENLSGFCKMPLQPKVARAALHFWEEPIISGKNGSGTVFFSGCPLRCIFCQNYEVSRGNLGKVITIEELADIFRRLESMGAENINLVSPTQYALAIRSALEIYRPKIPIVYNSGGYDSVETLRLLAGYIDIYLLDLKYLSNEKAGLFSAAPDYPQVAIAALKEAYRQQPQCVVENGNMKRGLIVRHLILPRNTNTATAVFDWVRENTPEAYFSIMSQYVPCGEAKEHPILGRKITKREYDKVLDYICKFNFKNIFIQELSSSSQKYIPSFDLTGV